MKTNKTNWVLIFSGDKMEGSRPLLCENKTPNEMKKIIVTEVKNFRDADKEMFLKGSIQIKDVKERYRDIGKNILVSLYGCAFFVRDRVDIEAHDIKHMDFLSLY